MTRIGFLLLPDFGLLSIATALEPLRSANRLLGRAHYGWRVYGDLPAGAEATEAPGSVTASNGLAIAVDGSLRDLAEELPGLDFLFVVAGLRTDPPRRARLNAVLAQAARSGIVLGSLSAGTFVLARAGLLDGYRCTVHWEFQAAFEEEFPEHELTDGLYVIDRDRWTGSGGVTGLDMMLQLIARDHGESLGRSVGNQFQIDRMRNAAAHQRPGNLARLETLPAPLQKAVQLMLGHLETPLRMQEIADLSGLNLRRMERLFKTHLDRAPAQFYRRVRLERARELLLHSNLSALEIGVLTGFSSSSHFAMAYAREFGARPSEERRNG
ncbi:MAG: GlxA family transcriptional regulator [Paracoccaceae bacterium]